ncbi:MAG: hypothetical protein ACREKL_13385, partial [Chthoniobacterales bacterium]
SKISLVLHATGGITNFKCKDMVIAHMSVTASTGNFHGTYISPETHAQYNVTGAVKPHEDTILISVYHHDAVTGLTYFCNTSAIKAK